jgi:hypothetical protein
MVLGFHPSWANTKIKGLTCPYGTNHWGCYHDAGGVKRTLRMEDFAAQINLSLFLLGWVCILY